MRTSALALMLAAFSASNVAARDVIGHALTLSSNRDLIVDISNPTAVSLCIEPNYGALTHVSVSVGGRRVGPPNAFEARPMPGCIELAPRAMLRTTYSASLLYANGAPPHGRVCHWFSWRRGRDGEAAMTNRSTRCVNW